MKLYSNRAGNLYHVQSDYDCYVPKSLNEVTINIDEEMSSLLDESNLLLGKLDMLGSSLPDRDIFISMYVQKEAIISSQIEGTQASLSDVLQKDRKDKAVEREEIVNYVHSLNYGLKLMDTLPISIRYFKEIHKELLKGVRGENKNPGEIRSSQNWIGPKGCTLTNASYIPPSVDKMKECLNDLELYINSDHELSSLIRIALIHYQFETIHPFLDGNGRLGRLLIVLWLKYNNTLNHPLLYLSLYFKENRNDYYSLLNDVRFKGKYEEWIKFFLRGIIETSRNSIETILSISSLKNKIFEKIENLKSRNRRTIKDVATYIFKHPFFSSSDLIGEFGFTKPTSLGIIKELVNLGVVTPTSDKKRYVQYKFEEYVNILEKGTEI